MHQSIRGPAPCLRPFISFSFSQCRTMRNPQSCPQCGQRNNAVGIFLFPPFPPFLSLSRHLRGNFQYGKICNVHAMCSGVKQCYYTTAPCFTALLVHLIERKRILALNKKCKKKKKQRRLSALKKKKNTQTRAKSIRGFKSV